MKAFERRLRMVESVLNPPPPPPPGLVLMPGQSAPVGFAGPIIRVRVVDRRTTRRETIQ